MSRFALLLWFATLALAGGLIAAEPTLDEALRQLRLSKFVMPEFPELVRLSGDTHGVVVVAIGRDAEGRVTDVLVLNSSNAGLSQAVVTAVGEWRFARPANRAGPDRPIIPIVRFLFKAGGVTFISAPSHGAGHKTDIANNPPMVFPMVADLDTSSEPLVQPLPNITGALLDRLAPGTATVKFFVDETGRVRVPIVLESTTPEYADAAIACIEQWRYEPPRIAGQPTIAIETATFHFRPRRS
jgi:TonB family protein